MVTVCATCEDKNKVIRFSCVRVTSAIKVLKRDTKVKRKLYHNP